MHPRWHTDRPGAPVCPKIPGDRSPGAPSEELFNEPLPDLAQQLTAELEGASWGVVAFAPEDAPWCDWIYRNLNGYPLPVSLVDRVTPHGFPRPDCVSIFPDRRDPAYEERWPHALEDGIYLIVVCSPHSARAEEVDEQIRAFKKAGGEERIIALVVDGPPQADLGGQRRAARCDWLPSWLSWRLEEEGFRAADRTEPRVVDARPGYRSLKQVRDSLLTALVDMDAAEFDRLGGCNRPVEGVTVPPTPVASRSSSMTTAVAISPSESPALSTDRRGSKFTIGVALGLILLAVVFGTRSFMEITADDPVPTLEVGPLAGHSMRWKTVEEDRASQAADLALADAASAPELAIPALVPPTPEPEAAKVAEPIVSSAATAAPAVPVAPVEVVAKANVTQLVPGPVLATSRIVPMGGGTVPAPQAQPEPVITSQSYAADAAATATTETDTVLLEKIKHLEQRGDENMAEKRTEEALDLYHNALLGAQEYAMRKGTNPVARDQVVVMLRKLGLLQLQNSSTAEARATYTQARRALLLLKQQGQWSHERAKVLDEIESRLLSLPRD